MATKCYFATEAEQRFEKFKKQNNALNLVKFSQRNNLGLPLEIIEIISEESVKQEKCLMQLVVEKDITKIDRFLEGVPLEISTIMFAEILHFKNFEIHNFSDMLDLMRFLILNFKKHIDFTQTQEKSFYATMRENFYRSDATDLLCYLTMEELKIILDFEQREYSFDFVAEKVVREIRKLKMLQRDIAEIERFRKNVRYLRYKK